ncbi:MAG: TM2 domain-containing protein [Chloroflexaceae bacterium]|nr:TM2 domain-containing protein [Chloroflexaceae bacterium]
MRPRAEKKFCYNCGVEVNRQQVVCVKCGVVLKGGLSGTGGKNKTTAGIFAILFGVFGVHKFYHGSWGYGILYILFFWTYIPAILGIIEGIIYLTMDEAKYDDKYNSTEKAPFNGKGAAGEKVYNLTYAQTIHQSRVDKAR